MCPDTRAGTQHLLVPATPPISRLEDLVSPFLNHFWIANRLIAWQSGLNPVWDKSLNFKNPHEAISGPNWLAQLLRRIAYPAVTVFC